MNDVARRTKVVGHRYHIQEWYLGRWKDWGGSGGSNKRSVKTALRYYRKQYPHIKFRLVKRTTTEEVVNG